MKKDDFDNNLASKVQDALSESASSYEDQTTEIQWSYIMEESQNRSRRVSRRTQLISVAAAAVVVIAITGAAIAVTSNGDNETIKTVDNTQLETVSTSTTVPLTDEEQLLQNAVLVNGIPVSETPTSPTMTYGKNGKEIDPTSEVFKRITQRIIRNPIYSPDHTKYARFTNLPNDIGWTGATLTIVDTETGKTTVVKPESFKYEGEEVAPEGQTISAVDLIWIDNDEFLMAASVNTANGISWVRSSLSKPISIVSANLDAIDNSLYIVAPSGTGGDVGTVDAAKYNGRAFALSTSTPFVEKDGVSYIVPGIIRVTVGDLDTGKIVWTTDIEINGSDFEARGQQNLSFGANENTVYGSLIDSKKSHALIHDHIKNKSYFPNADMALYIK